MLIYVAHDLNFKGNDFGFILVYSKGKSWKKFHIVTLHTPFSPV